MPQLPVQSHLHTAAGNIGPALSHLCPLWQWTKRDGHDVGCQDKNILDGDVSPVNQALVDKLN